MMRALPLAAVLLPSLGHAATMRVGLVGNFSPNAQSKADLTAAIAAAVDGDVIEIGNGTYTEALTINNKRLTLRSVATGGARPLLQTTLAQHAMTVTNNAVVTFEGLQWTSAGGRRCMRVTNGADVVFEDVRFQDCVHNDNGGALYVAADATVTGTSVYFYANPALVTVPIADKGGGFLWAQGLVDLFGGGFDGGTATRGGAIWVDGGSVSLGKLTPGDVKPEFIHNTATTGVTLTACGGAVCVTSGTLSLNEAYFNENSSAALGGHAGLLGGAMEDIGSRWLRGSAVHGGAIGLQSRAALTVHESVFETNTASSTVAADVPSGGAIYALGAGMLELDAPVINQCHATRGGGVYVGGAAGVLPTLTWIGGSVESGEAVTGAGVFLDDDVPATLDGVLLRDNTTVAGASPSNGGALALDRPGAVSLLDLTLTDNVASGDGGGLWWAPGAAALTVSGGTWSGNSASDGGAIAVEGTGDLDLFDLTLLSNRAGTGGALRQDAGSLDAVRTTFCANAATGDGGALWLGAVTSSLRASLLQENQGANGGAVRATGGSLSLVHAHVLGNRVTGANSAAVTASSASVLLRSSLIGWTETGRGVAVSAAPTAVASHNAFWSNAAANTFGITSTSSITVDPQLLSYDRDASCTDDQPWPTWASPLRGAAFTGSDPDGSPADIGAYGSAEAVGTPPWTLDGDNDGAAWAADCDDTASTRRPGAVETPADGVDQDCDRAEACYLDADRDTWGSATTGRADLACATAGFTPTPGDCDDNDGAERPGVQWYRDADADTWGGAATSTCARTQPSDVTRTGDCDDTQATVRPDGTEVPGDGVDQTCDGNELCYTDRDGDGFGVGVPTPNTSLSCTGTNLAGAGGDCDDGDTTERPGVTWYPDADRDSYGSAASAGASCARASSTDVTNRSDCDDTRSAVRPGATEQPADGTDQDCDGREQCWFDLDNDGYGRNATTLAAGMSCAAPGVSATNTDCDDDATDDTPSDQAALKYPGATHWLDADGDGWGRTSSPRTECNLSPGYSVRSGDCVDDPAADTRVQVAALIFPGATYWADGDGDGWGRAEAPNQPLGCGLPPGHGPRSGDCLDTDAAIYPGATYFPDVDGDGWGDAARGASAPNVCLPPAGLITAGGDCDDDPSNDTVGTEAALIRPGATYYNDRDGDGWGSGAGLSSPGLCLPPAGHKTRGGDCVDDPLRNTPGAESAGIYPNATYWPDGDGDGYGRDTGATTPQTCGLPSAHATRPGDCDDNPADDRVSGDAARTKPGASYGRDVDGDGWGRSAELMTSACAVPAGYAAAVGDCDDEPSDDRAAGDAALTFPGATYYLDLDADGFGTDNTGLTSPAICTPLPGYALRGGDCDDDARDDGASRAADIFPGATYWSDRDADGYGDATLPITPTTCGLPSGASTRDDDCDDDPSDDRPGADAASIHPDALLFVDADGDSWGDDATLTLVSECGPGTGWSSRGGDCDDDPLDDVPGAEAGGQYPGAPFWRDEDGDGYGRPGVPTSNDAVCVLLPGFSTRDDDCDDDASDDTPATAAASIHPGAAYWADRDGDSWGDASTPAPSECALPTGASVRPGDCDDDPADDTVGRAAAQIYPDASYWRDTDGDGFGAPGTPIRPLTCGLPPGFSTRDDDCDDDPSDDAPPARLAAATWPGAPAWRDADADGWGGAPVPTTTCEPLAGTSVTPGDCDDDPSDDAPGFPAAAIYPGSWWWPDVDGDTWGADGAGQARLDCTPAAGLVARGEDCDDDPSDDSTSEVAALIHPRAAYFRDRDDDGYGAGPAVLTDCALPAGHSVRDDDCDDDPSDDAPGAIAAEVYPGATYYRDADRDGWGDAALTQVPATCGLPAFAATRAGDCDDDPRGDTPGAEASAIFPGATYYRDADGDSWGDPARPVTPPTCGLPTGGVTRAGDCDDDASDDTPGREAAQIGPGATWYRDADGDTWGDPSTADAPAACVLPADSVIRAGDCDDEDDDAHPGLTELPGNTRDDDCDGVALCYVDADGDRYGRATTRPDNGNLQCDDSGEAEAAGDCDDDPSDDNARRVAAQIHPDAAETCGDGVDHDCSCVTGPLCDDERGDEDGDGLAWYVEVELNSADCRADSDGDGLGDDVEVALGSRLDSPDTDGDGVPDATEAPGGPPRNSDCAPEAPVGTVCDDVLDILDGDDDGDGAPTLTEGMRDEDCLARDALVIVPDGIGDWIDFDSDGDGVPDVDEAGLDADGDGVDDRVDCEEGDASADPDCDGLRNGVERLVGTRTDAADSDGDGLGDEEEVGDPAAPRDTDGDRLIDALDADDDGDGLLTADELGRTCADGSTPARGPGCPLGPWSCADGSSPTLRNRDALAVAPQQADDLPDALDPDDDGDGVPTTDESGADRDGDGIPDRWDGRDADGPRADTDADGLTNGEEALRGSDPLLPDTDGDGVPDGLEQPGDSDDDDTPDVLDDDDDGDGIPTAEEGATDPDGDRIPSWLDDDSDGDRKADADERPEADEDCDGVPDPWDAEDDGLCEAVTDTGERVPFDAAPTGCRCDGSRSGPLGMASWLLLLLARRRR